MLNEDEKKIIEWVKVICLVVITICLVYITFHIPAIMEHLRGIEGGVYNN